MNDPLTQWQQLLRRYEVSSVASAVTAPATQATPDDQPALLAALRQWLETHPQQRAHALAQLDLSQARSRSAYLDILAALFPAPESGTVASLRHWQAASLHRAELTDTRQLAALGLNDVPSWSQTVERFARLRAEYLEDSFSDIRNRCGAKAVFRIERALAGYLGKAAVFSSHPSQKPKFMFVPGLRGTGFLDPAWHPLVKPLEAAARDIQQEYDEAVAGGGHFEPFLGQGTDHDLSAYVSGRPGASWDALFFYRHGRRMDANHARFPKTSAVLDGHLLCRIDGQAPEICFSTLQAGSRIEPHHGVTNARVVVHIPLRVPPGCYLDVVGIGRHFWRECQAMVFDDTFEHAAENPSDMPRGILLMDSWHPDLSEAERAAFKCLVEAVTRIERLSLN
ncbi:MAG: aspartyl/asparaginyl beta-hydroxylase domain-containing protein [Rubrivivax sp.]|jgi:hypothetical protein|nr:aspartyl/asparaginyl beta-hydroxylase domain-containing protein [Rubrivivax sp.]